MADFRYIAADRSGKKVEGKLSVTNEGELRMVLRGQGLRPLKIQKAGIAEQDIGAMISGALGMGKGVPADRLLNFFRQLQTMINAGVPILQALEIQSEQEAHPQLKKILINSRERVKEGKFLWESFLNYPEAFERVVVAMIQAGETTGTLDIMLKRIGKYMENSYRLKRLIKTSMYYPIGVLSLSFVIVAGLLTWVIPQFASMLTQNGQALPWITWFMMKLSEEFRKNWYLIFAGMIGVALLIRAYVKTEGGRIAVQRLALKLPLFGSLIQKTGVARFCRTISTLLSSGVPVLDALDITRRAAGSIVFEEAIRDMRKRVEMGQTFGTAISSHPIFPRMVTQMIVVGESTGNLDKMTEKVADFYEEEVETTVTGMTKLIEPFLIVFIGGMIATVMIAMYLPIFMAAGGAT